MVASLVVSTLMVMAVFAVVGLLEIDDLTVHHHQSGKQQAKYLESACVVYEHFPELFENDREGLSCRLHSQTAASDVHLSTKEWGLYDLVLIENHDRTRSRMCLFGKKNDGESKTALYYPNRNGSLNITRRTALQGNVYIPAGGILYTAFTGQAVPQDRIRRSDEELPPVGEKDRRRIDRLFNPDADVLPENDLSKNFNSFTDQPEYLVLKDSSVLMHYSASGNFVIRGDGYLEIDKSCRLQDVLVVAGTVRIKSGFRGCAQLFARDSIIVEDNVTLLYPSGLYLYEGGRERCVTAGEKCEINGYVIVGKNREENRQYVNYRQSESAVVRGLVYIDGVAQIEGIVHGSLYATRLLAYTDQGQISNTLRDAAVLYGEITAFPHFLPADQQNKFIKWLY